jgi:hypothetical protein
MGNTQGQWLQKQLPNNSRNTIKADDVFLLTYNDGSDYE